MSFGEVEDPLNEVYGCILGAGSAEGLTHSKCAEAGLHRSVKWSEVVHVARLDAFPPTCSVSNHLWLGINIPRPLACSLAELQLRMVNEEAVLNWDGNGKTKSGNPGRL